PDRRRPARLATLFPMRRVPPSQSTERAYRLRPGIVSAESHDDPRPPGQHVTAPTRPAVHGVARLPEGYKRCFDHRPIDPRTTGVVGRMKEAPDRVCVH